MALFLTLPDSEPEEFPVKFRIEFNNQVFDDIDSFEPIKIEEIYTNFNKLITEQDGAKRELFTEE